MTPVPRRDQALPTGALIVASIVFLVVFMGLSLVFPANHQVPWPVFLIVRILGPLFLAAYILGIGYVYGDAKRRGMRYVMWTMLAIFVPNGIGIILYFIMRDPYPVYCAHCGGTMQPNHGYCPRCGSAAAAACPACHKAAQPGWTHCAWCGTKL